MHLKVLIVEDEKPAQEHLQRLLRQLQPDLQVLDCLDTVRHSVQWLQTRQADLIFMDIHLADGLSFSIFEQVQVGTPIIFTTAYDEYALKAFKVNSIDYLLKPIDEDDLHAALQKFTQRQPARPALNITELLEAMRQPAPGWQERFLVHRGERLMSVLTEQIAYFEGEDRYVYLVKNDGSRYIVDYRLSDLEQLLNPAHFFRLNRSFIAHFSAIHSMISMSKSRIKVELLPAARRPVIVSTESCQAFKEWLNR